METQDKEVKVDDYLNDIRRVIKLSNGNKSLVNYNLYGKYRARTIIDILHSNWKNILQVIEEQDFDYSVSDKKEYFQLRLIPCLKCNIVFLSMGIFNRLCNRCKELNSSIVSREFSIGLKTGRVGRQDPRDGD